MHTFVRGTVKLKEYQATTRFFERQDQDNSARVEERAGSSPRRSEISLAPHVVLSFDHVLNIGAFGRVENEERDHPPVPNGHIGDTRVSHDRDGLGIDHPMPFIFQLVSSVRRSTSFMDSLLNVSISETVYASIRVSARSS